MRTPTMSGLAGRILIGLCALWTVCGGRTAAAQCEVAKILAPEGPPGFHFGKTVAIDPKMLIIGAAPCWIGLDCPPDVFIYQQTGEAWQLVQQLLPPPGLPMDGDCWGAVEIALEGDLLAIGAPGCLWDAPTPGAVYLYSKDLDGWVQTATLLPPDGESGDHFGSEIEIGQSFIVVGAPTEDEAGDNAGAAYVYAQADNEWLFQEKLLPTGGSTYSSFGSAIDSFDNVVAIGAPSDYSGASDTGRVYIYDLEQSTLQEAQILEPPLNPGDKFGISIAFDESTLLVASNLIIRAYQLQNSEWVQTMVTLVPAEGAIDEIAIDAGTGVVVASQGGLAFQHEAETITFQAVLMQDYLGGAGSGDRADVDGDVIAIGHPHDDTAAWASGAVYVFSATAPDSDADLWLDACDNCQLVSNYDQADCDGDAIGDACAIADGLRSDCDFNGIPDNCDVLEFDCNNNDIPDACDIADGTSNDCNLNYLSDACELPMLGDCNQNGILDTCEIDSGLAADCDLNGVIDSCEAGTLPVAYALDDGMQDTSIGITVSSIMPQFVWFNHFQVEPGGELIVAVDMVWGEVDDGTPAEIGVWVDPTNDGFPTDAVLVSLNQQATVIKGDSGEFVRIPVPAAYVGETGQSFYVGARILATVEAYPAAFDTTDPAHQSWYTFTTDMAELAQTEHPELIDDYLPGNWMVRAVCIGNDANNNGVPDPCDADLSGDGQVGALDLALLLGAWGQCKSGDSCNEDLNGDGVVGVADLAALLSMWST